MGIELDTKHGTWDGAGSVFILAETVGRKGLDTLRTGTGWEETQSKLRSSNNGELWEASEGEAQGTCTDALGG